MAIEQSEAVKRLG